MNWNFSAWAIRQPVPSLVLFVVLCAVGLTTFAQLPVTRFPNIDVPIVQVLVNEQGTAPAELETQITRKVEDAVANLAGVDKIISTLTDSASSTIVQFRLETDTAQAVQDVKDAIANIRGDLPATIDEPIIQRIDVEGSAILGFAASAPDMTLEQLSWHVDDVIARELRGVKGVGRVTRIGGVDREIQVRLDPDRLMSLGITAADVNRQLRATNLDNSGGRGEIGGQEQAIRMLASQRSVEELSQTKIVLPGGREVRLSDLGTVIDGVEEPRSFARVNGEAVVAVAIFRAKGASDVDVRDRVMTRISKLQEKHPGVTITKIDDSVSYTEGNYKSAMATLIEGALLAILVVLVFLRDWRATIIAAVAIPLSIIPTFWAMELMGFSLNLVSLLAITLVTGILVDDAIVEIENIVRHIRMGKSAYRAALEAADEIGLAVIAISFTIIAVFAPVSFMGGIAGQYFKQFGLTVAVAVFFSLLVARLVTPMMAAYFMRGVEKVDDLDAHNAAQKVRVARATTLVLSLIVGSTVLGVVGTELLQAFGLVRDTLDPIGLVTGALGHLAAIPAALFGAPGLAGNVLFQAVVGLAAFALLVVAVRFLVTVAIVPHVEEEGHDGAIMRAYTRFLEGTLRHRWMTLIAGIGIFAASIWSVGLLPTGFIPTEDASRIMISAEIPTGSRLEDTRRMTDRMTEVIRQEPEVKSVYVMGGATPTGERQLRKATVIVELHHKSTRTTTQKDVETRLSDKLADIPDLRIFYANDRGERELTVQLLGSDPAALDKAVASIESAVRRMDGYTNVFTNAGLERPEIRVRPKLEEAADLGIAPAQISETIRVATIGDQGSSLARFNTGDRLIPIRVQLQEGAREDLRVIQSLKVTGATGATVPVSAVADIDFGKGPSSIRRFNRERAAVIGADLTGGLQLGAAVEKIMALPEVKNLPAGVRLQETGDAEIMGEVFAGFAEAMFAGILMVLGVLILLFGSVTHPITILLSLPLSIGGVIFALLVSGKAISMPVVIGILMLMGIVTKNAIMLVDFAIEQVHRGVPRAAAIIDAGRKRARPIVMTTIAMSAGMLPSAYGVGDGGEFRAPMAIAVIGGLLISTVLSLIFVPSFYTIMDDVNRFFSWVFGRFVGPRDEPTEEELAAAAAAHGAPAAVAVAAPVGAPLASPKVALKPPANDVDRSALPTAAE